MVGLCAGKAIDARAVEWLGISFRRLAHDLGATAQIRQQRAPVAGDRWWRFVHNAEELALAERWAWTSSPVTGAADPDHPDAQPLGWEQASTVDQRVQQTGVSAGRGREVEREQAWRGAQGVAGFGRFGRKLDVPASSRASPR
jgi:8-oxo-dGTP diphosphatase